MVLCLLQNCKTGIITEELKKDNVMFETFDYDKFEKENEKYKESEHSDTYFFKNGKIIYASQYEFYEIPPFPYFYLNYKEFYEYPDKPSNIKEKGKYFGDLSLRFVGNIKIGYWYYFDENGNLIQQVDEDKKFGKFGYNEVLKFLDEQKHINLKTGEGRDRVKIDFYYSDKTPKKLWNIFVKVGEAYQIPGEGYRIEQKGKGYYLDGDTGEIIKGKKLLEYREIIPNFEQQFPWLLESKTVYKSYEGKNYTQEEWKAFEQKTWEEHQKKNRK